MILEMSIIISKFSANVCVFLSLKLRTETNQSLLAYVHFKQTTQILPFNQAARFIIIEYQLNN